MYCYHWAGKGEDLPRNKSILKRWAQNGIVSVTGRRTPPQSKMQCLATKTNGHRCSKPSTAGDTLCRLHRTVATRTTLFRNAREVWNDILDVLWTDRVETVVPLRAIIEAAVLDRRIDVPMGDVLVDDLNQEWVFYQMWRPPPAVLPKSELHALTMDAQNVHTTVVARQTTATVEMLANTPVPETQDPFREVAEAWGRRSGWRRVVLDMGQWYNTSECREENDWLYRRVLDGLWARIKVHSDKAELVERLWEECSEATKMCCEGHISRLCNVLVGFDDGVKASVSVGELLQQQIAVIAAKDTSVEYKVGDAWAVFEELKIPMDQRQAWIDAF